MNHKLFGPIMGLAQIPYKAMVEQSLLGNIELVICKMIIKKRYSSGNQQLKHEVGNKLSLTSPTNTMQVLQAPSSPHLSIQTSKPPHLTWGVPLSYNLFTSCDAHNKSLSYFLSSCRFASFCECKFFTFFHPSFFSSLPKGPAVALEPP